MKLFEIKTRSTQLTNQSDYDSTNLVACVFNQYYLKLESKFKNLFSMFRNKHYLHQQLFNILSDNWGLIKGTGLCYTATPDDDVTFVMIGIAIYLSQQQEYSDKHPIELLMPGVNFESVHDDFPNLNVDSYRTQEQISNIMQTHILADNGLYLIPVILLTTLDISPLPTKLINPYYHFIQHTENCGFIKPKEISRLFEHSKMTQTIQAKKDTYDSIANLENHLLGRLRKLCKSLKLSSRYEDGSEMEAGLTAYQGMVEFSEFYNQLFKKTMYTRNKFPMDLSEFNNSYLFIKKSNLYFIQNSVAELIPLTNKSQFRTRLRDIRDQQSNESPALQLSVLDLHQLIEESSEHQTIDTRISSALKREIIQLLKFTTNPEANLEATQETSNCVVTLRESLMIQISGQEELLTQFKLESAMQVNIEPAIREFEQSMQTLKARVLSNTYDIGYDNLESYGNLFGPLNVDFEINTIDELDFIESMCFETIQGIFKNQALRQQAVSQFTTINDLVCYLIDLPLQSVENFISCVKNELCFYLIENIKHLNELVRVMDAEYCAVVLKHIGPLRIHSIDDFIALQKNLDIQPFQMACQQLKSLLEGLLNLTDFIRADTDFQNPEKSLFWKTHFLYHAISQIQTHHDWAQLKSYMTIEQSEKLFAEKIEEWAQEIDNLADVEVLFKQLSGTQQSLLIQAVTPKISGMILDTQQLVLFLSMLPPLEAEQFIQEHQNLLERLTENNAQLSQFFSSLSSDLQIMVSNLIRPHIFSVVLLTPNDNSWNEPPEEIALYLLLKPVLSALQQLSDSSRSFDFIDALINGDESTLKLHFSRLLIEHTSHRFFMARPQTNMILQELIKLPEFLKMKLFSSLDIDGVTQNQSQQFKILKRKCDELNQHQPEAKKHKAHSPF